MNRRPSTRDLVGCLLGVGIAAISAAGASAQELISSRFGDTAHVAIGHQVVTVGDVDADGANDVIANHPGSGSVYVYSGKTGALIKSLAGETGTGGKFGVSASGIGDFDGDGTSDVAIGDPSFVDPLSGGAVGKVYVYSGSDWSILRSWTGGNNSGFGTSIAGVGDTNADGIPEIAVGSPDVFSSALQAGRVELLGSGIVVDGSTYDRLGVQVLGTGDVDDDGVPDFAATAGTGYVRVYSGATGVVLRGYSPSAGDRLGLGGPAGDCDGDGYCDVALLLNHHSTGLRTASVYSGRDDSLLWEKVGDSSSDIWSVAGVGDVDVDGSDEIAVGFPMLDEVIVYSVARQATLSTIFGFNTPEEFGATIAAMGDVDGDGYPDLAVGATLNNVNVPEGGAVYVVTCSLPPRVTSVTPDRGRYDAGSIVTITGRNFLAGTNLDVRFGDDAPDNVQVLDDASIQCSAPAGESGSVDLLVLTDVGIGGLTDGFTYTPALRWDGNAAPGGHVAVHFLCDRFDGIFAIAGVPPEVTIPTRPFDGELCIFPFNSLFVIPPHVWPFDEFTLDADIPSDPSLSGLTVLLQALVGPSFAKPKDASWTNCPSIIIE